MILHHVNKYDCNHPKLVEQIRTGLYVDDLVTGNDSVESAFKTNSVSKQIMKEAGLNLQKWKTNSPELLPLIEERESNQGTYSDKPNLTIVEGNQSCVESLSCDHVCAPIVRINICMTSKTYVVNPLILNGFT